MTMLNIISSNFSSQIVDEGAGGLESQRYCGEYKQSFTYTSSSNDIVVNFVSDNWEARTGYFASYKFIPSYVEK